MCIHDATVDGSEPAIYRMNDQTKSCKEQRCVCVRADVRWQESQLQAHKNIEHYESEHHHKNVKSDLRCSGCPQLQFDILVNVHIQLQHLWNHKFSIHNKFKLICNFFVELIAFSENSPNFLAVICVEARAQQNIKSVEDFNNVSSCINQDGFRSTQRQVHPIVTLM